MLLSVVRSQLPMVWQLGRELAGRRAGIVIPTLPNILRRRYVRTDFRLPAAVRPRRKRARHGDKSVLESHAERLSGASHGRTQARSSPPLSSTYFDSGLASSLVNAGVLQKPLLIERENFEVEPFGRQMSHCFRRHL